MPNLSVVLLTFLLVLVTTRRGEIVTERVPILDQLNASLDPSNKLVSQKFTDILPQMPMLRGADDFVLPANISANITMMQLSFAIVRQFRDSDPDSITVSLMYNDPLTQGPGQVFFTKSIRAPNNPPRWHNDSLNVAEVITFNITQNEESATNPSVYFNFGDPAFLPRQTRLWLTMYVTGSRSYDIAPPHAENVLFWCIAANAPPPPVNNTWQDAPYFFMDEADIMGRGLTNWTNASRAESPLGFVSRSRNTPWAVTLVGTAPSTFLEMLQTMDTKKLIAVVVCSVIGLLFVCACVLCICKRCRRCKRSGGGSSDSSISFINLNDKNLYKEVPITDFVPTDVSLEGSTNSSYNLKSTPSGRHLASATQIPVKTRNTSNKNSDEFDKEK